MFDTLCTSHSCHYYDFGRTAVKSTLNGIHSGANSIPKCDLTGVCFLLADFGFEVSFKSLRLCLQLDIQFNFTVHCAILTSSF